MVNLIHSNAMLRIILIGAYRNADEAKKNFPRREGQGEWEELPDSSLFLKMVVDTQEKGTLKPVSVHRKNIGDGCLLILDYGF